MENIVNNISLKVINFEEHKTLIERSGVIYKNYLDLAILPTYNGNPILREELNNLNLTIDEVFDLVFRKAREGAKFGLMTKFYPQLPETVLYLLIDPSLQEDWGAAIFFCPEWQEEIRDEFGGTNYLIIPSSVHESLILPIIDGIDANFIIYMIKSVNSTLNPEDKLSDNLYYYNGESLMIVQEEEFLS